MDLWSKARSFAQEAAKRSQELTMEAAKRSQEITIGGSRLTDIVSEASKRSLELAAEASKHADLIKIEALKRADQIKSLSIIDSSVSSPSSSSSASAPAPSAEELEAFGVTDELREFVKEITLNTFKEFPLPDDSSMSDVPTVSNVRQDLTEWQAKHANLVLSTVKEISKLRYELCPRFMKDRKFWRIYFILVNSHITPYEKRYMEELKLKEEQDKEDKAKEASKSEAVSRSDGTGTSQKSKSSKSSAEQDLDIFLLGDLGDDDDGIDGPDDGDDEEFDDDFDKIVDSSEDERAKDSDAVSGDLK